MINLKKPTFWGADAEYKKSIAADGIKKPLELHKQFSQKFLTAAIFLLAPGANHDWYKPFLLVAWNGSKLFFWSRSWKRTRSSFAFPLSGWDSLLLFWLALLYSPSPFLLGQIFSSPTPFLVFAFLDKNFLFQFLFSLLFGQKCSKSNFKSAKIFKDESKFCLSRKIIPISQKKL